MSELMDMLCGADHNIRLLLKKELNKILCRSLNVKSEVLIDKQQLSSARVAILNV